MDYPNPQQVAEKRMYADQTTTGGPVMAGIAGSCYRPSPLEDSLKERSRIELRHGQLGEGIAFLQENPAFNQFIELIRKGCISI